ncbi:MAG: deoxyribose-phosphate aldolase [Burkholderiales bacterium]
MSAQIQHARIALACLDLTSLNDADTEADVARLCERAQGPHGPVAAVCVWPRFAAFARGRLPMDIGVAAVANFPDGSADIERAVRDTRAIVDAGAQEVDVVLPFARLQQRDELAVTTLLQAVRRACDGLVLKVILETGVLATDALVARASRLALAVGADFLKTSTGKTPVSATPQAARVMLNAISVDPRANAHAGFKASGGIRTVAEASVYIDLCAVRLDAAALTPARFRIGASSLLNDIEAVLGGQLPPPAAAPGTY